MKWQEIQNYRLWLAKFTIGKPRATKGKTVEEIEKMGFVGLYEDMWTWIPRFIKNLPQSLKWL